MPDKDIKFIGRTRGKRPAILLEREGKRFIYKALVRSKIGVFWQL